MTKRCLVFHVFDDLNRTLDNFCLSLNDKSDFSNEEDYENHRHKFKKRFVTVYLVDGYFVSAFRRLIEISKAYQKIIVSSFVSRFYPITAGGDINVKYQLVKPKLDVLDYKWNERLRNLLFERQQLENSMSWLSTLGGAFSALGDNFQNCAKIAGKISIQQFKIAFRLGEPPLVARCKLYMALSLIQLGKLSIAKTLIEEQYEVAKNCNDIRLENMCKGIWAKLKYMHKLKKNNSKKNKL